MQAQALQFEQTGSLNHLALVTRSVPTPASGEALVLVKAAGLNPSDAKNVLGRFPYTALPRTPGRDFAGMVLQGPAEWVGRAVWGSGKELGFTRDGSHAEYLCLPASALSAKPEGLDFPAAASCGVPFITALDAIERSGVTAATAVLVIGAAGAVGYAAIQLARAQGARVLAGVRKSAQAERLQQEGFDTVLLETQGDLPDIVQTQFGAGADVIVDTTGLWLATAVNALAIGGRIAVIAAPDDGMVNIPVLQLYRRGGSIIGVNSLLHDAVTSAVMLSRLAPLFEAGQLKVRDNLRVVPLPDALSAYQAVLAGSPDKFVLRP